MPTAAEIAAWMKAQIETDGHLYQSDAASGIRDRFGASFVETNDGGGESILPAVLSEFRKLTADSVVWDRAELLWRARSNTDAPGRQQ